MRCILLPHYLCVTFRCVEEEDVEPVLSPAVRALCDTYVRTGA